MIAVEDLSVTMAGRAVLQGVSFTAQRGAFVCVLGPNGAGKTTLLRAIAGLCASSGRAVLDGADLSMLKPAERARLVAYLPQGHVAHWPITARDAVAIGRVPHGGQPGRLTDHHRAVVERMLIAVDAGHLADRPVTEMSGGERARVMLARALAVEAPLLLADEAVAALDPAHQLVVMGLLAKVAADGAIVLAALHDLTLASRFASTVLVLDRGRIAGHGPPDSVLRPDLLARVFGITAAHLQHDGQPIVVPWSTQTRATQL